MAVNNDMIIIFTILSIFITVGVIGAFVNEDFNTGIGDNTVGANALLPESGYYLPTSLSVFSSIFQVIFWGFGFLPTWFVTIFLLPLRILLLLTIARNVWVGGGA